MAIEAARAGKHLLLEKPLCISVHDADRLVEEVDNSAVSSVVFFTLRFSEVGRTWLRATIDQDWCGGWARFIVAAFGPNRLYAASPWRHDEAPYGTSAPTRCQCL